MGSELEERAAVSAAYAVLLLVLATCSQCCTGPLQRISNTILNALLVSIAAISLFGSCAIAVLFMVVFLPLYYSPWPGTWYAIANSLWSHPHALCVVFSEVFGGYAPLFRGDELQPGESVIILANHLSDLDFVITLSLAARLDALGGLRFIGKAALAKVPIIGWGLWLHHTIFIKSRPQGRRGDQVFSQVDSSAAAPSAAERARTVAADMEGISATVRSVITKQSDCQPVWIGLFPEGTRITPEQHKRALEYAKEEGLSAFKYLLQPRVKGLNAVMEAARPRITHVLDLTVAYGGFCAECEKNPRQANILDAITRDQPAHVLVRRLALPAEGEDTLAWLQGVWADKERALARWEHDGSFEAEPLRDLPLLIRPLLGGLIAYIAFAALIATGAVLATIEVYHYVSSAGRGYRSVE